MPVSAPTMPPSLLKICGLRLADQAAAVARLGVDAVGVIGVPGTPRFLEPERRAALFAAVQAASPSCKGVLVVADPDAEQLPELERGRGHAIVQLHGSESPERCELLRRDLGCELWKALRIRTPGDLARAGEYAEVVDALLLDAWVPDQLGGSGHRIPIEWLEGFAPSRPWWLAGGMRADRVAPVLARLSPTGLDASSGVERAPGDKNLPQVAALLTAVRAASQPAG